MRCDECTPPHRRRFGVIETRFRQHGGIAYYDLTINGELWACVEWSPARRAWCVQDASGRCLAHCDAIHGENVDAGTAVRLAKVMIRDGRMPTPEEAEPQSKCAWSAIAWANRGSRCRNPSPSSGAMRYRISYCELA